MKAHNDPTENFLKVNCSFSNHLNMPPLCTVCGSEATEKYKVIGHTKSRMGRVVINFPICSKCLSVKNEYINAPLISAIGIVALIFSIYTIFNQPAYLKIPAGLHTILGAIWIFILLGFLIWILFLYRQYSQSGKLAQKKQIDSAVTIENLILPTKRSSGTVTFLFLNHKFGRLFKKIN